MANEITTHLTTIMVKSTQDTDIVYLKHNQLMVFSLVCRPGRELRLSISRDFHQYSVKQWDQVFIEYLEWKRQTSPKFKLENYSGRRKDGRTHPWRMFRHPRRTRPPEADL
jgi:hypothetical protein